MSPLGATTDYNLVLTGSLGPNQLIIARRVAERLKLRFVDSERELEQRAEMPPAQFKTLFGEARTRALESQVIHDLALHRGCVLHISGQMLAYGDHLARIRDHSYILCLVATLDAVLTRLHIALGARYHVPAERALALGALQRDWAIRGQGGVHELDTTAMQDSEVIERITAIWSAQVIEFTRVS